MPVQDLPIFMSYDRQRFTQFSPQDCANWYINGAPSGKRQMALYPTMGRKHIQNSTRSNVFVYDIEPRAIFRSIDFMYVVVGSQVFQYSDTFVKFTLSNSDFTRKSGPLYFAFLPTTQGTSVNSPQKVFCMLTDGRHIYVIDESNKTMTTVTDSNAPQNPLYVAAFGNRFVVASLNSTQFSLTQINLGSTYDPSTCFTDPALGAVFAQETGLIKQLAVLHNQLYIFTDYTTGIWSNTPSVFQSTGTAFPWKKNSSYDWDYGMQDPLSLDVDFGRMTWLAQNRNGLVQFMTSSGQMPQSISTQAINVLLQEAANSNDTVGFILNTAVGFLYQYEDTVFYRVSAGDRIVDESGFLSESANSLEYNFETQTWHRCIENNGSRNLIQDHIFFARKHIVSALGQPALYEMAGNIYYNELRNTSVGPQAANAFIAYPFRYELITPIIYQPDYSEFITDYIEIDFVWGNQFIRTKGPFENITFIVGEESASDGNPVFMVSEDGESYMITEKDSDGNPANTPTLNSTIYTDLYKPHVELYASDDGGVSFFPLDVREFSQLGIYSWRMRWYQCGPSRNRCYKLVGVSPNAIVVLGAVQNVRRASGGAN